MSNVLPADTKILEARVQDSLSRFLEIVADLMVAAAQRSDFNGGAFLLCPFAESLGRVLMGGSIRTVWESRRTVFGAFLERVGVPAVSMDPGEAARLLVEPKRALSDPETAPPFRDGSVAISWITGLDGAEAVRIASEARPVALWLLRPAHDVASPMWRWFKSYLPGLKSHFVTLHALIQTRAAAEAAHKRPHYAARVKQIGHERAKDFGTRMAEVSRLLDELDTGDEPDFLDLVEDLAVLTLQELMGAGWTVRQVGRLNADRPSSPGLLAIGPDGAIATTARPESNQLDEVRRKLDAMLESLAPASGESALDGERGARMRRLAEVSRCFRALLDDEDAPPSTEPRRGDEALALLPVWTRVHEACRLLCRPRPAAQSDYDKAGEVWAPAVDLTLALLPRHLELHPALPGTDAPPESRRRGSPSARNWLALWLALEVLRAVGRTAQLGDREGCSLHADLAYVLREGLRYACFGQRTDYFYQPSTYAAALRRLVEYHAHKIIGLPLEYNIVRLLEEIGEQDGLNRYVAAEHLQHVLEIYIAGNFILSVRIRVPDAASSNLEPAKLDGQTVAEALSSGGGTPSPESARLLMRAYCLASLFHDVGHLLFPRDSIPHDSLDWDDPEIAAGLRKVEDSVSEAGGEVAQKCLDDLGLAYYSKDEIARWREELAGREPNHGLLGAWYLHRVGRGVLERSADTDRFREVQTAILYMAVRAVLMHGAATGHIHADKDPVAAMLIACNEIFEWDPGRHLAPAPSSIGRSFHVMAADVPAREPRDAWIKIPSLSVRAGDPATGALDATLIVDPTQETFPEIHIGLQAPHRLDVPVLRLWLLKAQSLGRLVPTRQGLCPTVVMRSRIDVTLLSRGLTTKSLLDRVAERRSLAKIRPALRAWLARGELFEEETTESRTEEVVRLGPLKQHLLFTALFDWLHKIEEEAWGVVQSIDADSDDQPSSKRFWGQG